MDFIRGQNKPYFSLRVVKLPGLSRNGPQTREYGSRKRKKNFFFLFFHIFISIVNRMQHYYKCQ